MKKLFGWVLSAIFLAFPFLGGIAYCTDPINPAVQKFVDEIWERREQFAYDEKNRDKLTFDFDKSHPSLTFSESNEAYHDEVDRQLANGEKVKLSSSALAGWTLVELRKRGIECREISIAKRNKESMEYHFAVLVQCGIDTNKNWRVCDISEMSRSMLPEYESVLACPHWFLNCSLDAYMNDCFEALAGIIVNYEEFSGDDADFKFGGRDICAWLATDGKQEKLAHKLIYRPTIFGGAVFMSLGPDRSGDLLTVLRLRDSLIKNYFFPFKITEYLPDGRARTF